MKTEHEKLEEICYRIWYKTEWDISFIHYFEDKLLDSFINLENTPMWYRIINLKEIIFTTNFMKKFAEYTKNDQKMIKGEINLEHPVDYLYKLI